MNLSFKDKKTGKWYNADLEGANKQLVLRFYTFLGLTGSLLSLTAMSYIAYSSQGRQHSQEVFLAFAIVTILVGKRAFTLSVEVRNMLHSLIPKNENEHPHQ